MSTMRIDIIGLLPRLRRFAVSLTGNLCDGDDLLHNAVERALKRSETYDNSRKLESWMFAIIKNIWIDDKRALSRRGPVVDIDEQINLMSVDGRVVTEQKQMTEKVFKAMATLPETQQQVALHVLVDGKSYKETAEELSLPIGTIMSSLSRARKTLAEKILQEGPMQ